MRRSRTFPRRGDTTGVIILVGAPSGALKVKGLSEMLGSLLDEVRGWRYEWVPFTAFVWVLAVGIDDLSFSWPWLFGLAGLFYLARGGRRAAKGGPAEELSPPARSESVISVIAGLVILAVGMAIVFVPTGAGAELDGVLLLLLGAGAAVNLMNALNWRSQRAAVRSHWATAHPGEPLPGGTE